MLKCDANQIRTGGKCQNKEVQLTSKAQQCVDMKLPFDKLTNDCGSPSLGYGQTQDVEQQLEDRKFKAGAVEHLVQAKLAGIEAGAGGQASNMFVMIKFIDVSGNEVPVSDVNYEYVEYVGAINSNELESQLAKHGFGYRVAFTYTFGGNKKCSSTSTVAGEVVPYIFVTAEQYLNPKDYSVACVDV